MHVVGRGWLDCPPCTVTRPHLRFAATIAAQSGWHCEKSLPRHLTSPTICAHVSSPGNAAKNKPPNAVLRNTPPDDQRGETRCAPDFECDDKTWGGCSCCIPCRAVAPLPPVYVLVLSGKELGVRSSMRASSFDYNLKIVVAPR
jgi:hypothetical protein